MKILNTAILVLLILLSSTAGIAKVMQVPAEMEFLQGVGLSPTLVILFGLTQLAGGALLIFRKTRTIGAIVVAATLVISTVTIFMSGNIRFGLFSVLPIGMAGIVLFESARQRPNGVGQDDTPEEDRS